LDSSLVGVRSVVGSRLVGLTDIVGEASAHGLMNELGQLRQVV
jgi:hypothetical protein